MASKSRVEIKRHLARAFLDFDEILYQLKCVFDLTNPHHPDLGDLVLEYSQLVRLTQSGILLLWQEIIGDIPEDITVYR